MKELCRRRRRRAEVFAKALSLSVSLCRSPDPPTGTAPVSFGECPSPSINHGRHFRRRRPSSSRASRIINIVVLQTINNIGVNVAADELLFARSINGIYKGYTIYRHCERRFFSFYPPDLHQLIFGKPRRTDARYTVLYERGGGGD